MSAGTNYQGEGEVLLGYFLETDKSDAVCCGKCQD